MSETLLSISFQELCQIEGVERQFIIKIVEYGIVVPLEENTDPTCYENWLFDTSTIHWLKKALRLHRDLEIDWIAIAMVIDLMRQKEALIKEKEMYRRQLTRFINTAPIDG